MNHCGRQEPTALPQRPNFGFSKISLNRSHYVNPMSAIDGSAAAFDEIAARE